MELLDNLEEVVKRSWDLLFRSTVTRNDPARNVVVGTSAFPAGMRIMVLREVAIAERKLSFYTDSRSGKMAQLEADPRVSLLVWHPGKMIQLRLGGEAVCHHRNEVAAAHWERTPVISRKPYATVHAPGTPLETGSEDLPFPWTAKLTPEQTDFARQHFVVVEVTVETLDFLHLHRKGHQRAGFRRQDDHWQGSWLVP